MRHQKRGKTLGRKRDQRRALFLALSRSFMVNMKIMTTVAKAKELKKVVEPMITRAKKDTLANRRELAKILDKRSLKILFEDIAPVYLQVKGGYTKIIKTFPRKGDGADMAILELTKKINVRRKEDTKQASKKEASKPKVTGKASSKKAGKK